MRYADNVTRAKAPKPALPRKPSRLSEKAIAGAVIEAAGATAEEIGRKVGVHAQTVGEWRRSPEYRDLVNGHRAKTEAAIRDDLLDVRRKVLDGIAVAASCVVQMLEEERAAAAGGVDEDGEAVSPRPLDTDVVVKGTKALVDLWRPIAAQTGITEASKVEVSVSPPEEARQLLRAELKTLTTEELRALRAKDD